MNLPIESVLPELLQKLRAHTCVVLSAAPGAGKTTRVPLAMLDAGITDKKILMLEPRRLAAMRAAQYMATQLGEKAGERVGYRIRGMSKISARTKIEVVTEGILTRLLQNDTELADYGVVIFDEFHERSLHADLGLAFCCEVQASLREDLKLLVMSATLDGVAVSQLLGGAPIVQSEGRAYPVRTVHVAKQLNAPLEPQLLSLIARALREEDGDVLLFLPGQREIRRLQTLLAESENFQALKIHALYGEATPEQQQAALQADAQGARKIILATSIAETSLTIDGVRIVIDAGLARISRFDPRRGMSGLATVNVSQATAEQRRGRAGRQQTGACYRLWGESQHGSLARYPDAEILQSDLAPLALELALWGSDETHLKFLDAPPAAHIAQARTLLRELGALDAQQRITAHGRAMAALPLHPRYAHMLLRAKALGQGALACEIAALLEERDLLRGRDADCDLHARLLALRQAVAMDSGGVDHAARQRAREQARRLRQMLNLVRDDPSDDRQAGLLLAFAYPERVARRREKHGLRYQLASGVGALLPNGSRLANAEWIAIAELDGEGSEARVFLAEEVEPQQLQQHLPEMLSQADEVQWSLREEAVVARRVAKFGALILSESALPARGEAVTAAVLDGIRRSGLRALRWERESEELLTRLRFWQQQAFAPGNLGDWSESALLDQLENWLAPFLNGITRRSQFAQIDVQQALLARLAYALHSELNRLFPTHLIAPTGSRIAIDYSANTPVLALRLQEMFGQATTPRIADGRIAVTLHLLSPAQRPLAVTQDLASFWQNAYIDVRKDMRGQYPRHYWPENPLEAEPTRRTKAADDRARKT